MTYIIPNQTKKIIQTNESDISGNLYVTKNIDLRNNGYIKLSHPAISVLSEDEDADLTSADSMFKSAGDIFLLGKEVFSGSGSFGTWTNRKTDTGVPTPGVEEDGIYFNATEVISDTDKIYYRSASTTWTALDIDLAGPAQMTVLDTFNVLLVGGGNKVYMIDTSWVLTKTLTLPAEYEVTSLDTNGSVVYIGTRHIAKGEGKLFTWDGSSSAWNGSYGANAVEISSVRKYGASCALVTSKGQLLQFNGSSFSVLGNFPIYYLNNSVNEDSQNDHSFVSNRGIYVDDNKIYIKINAESTGNIDKFSQNFVGGLWLYTPETGLNCLSTPSYTKVVSKTIATTNVNTTDNIITTTNVPVTGTPCIYNADYATILTGLDEFTTYYVIYLSSTTLKLATSYTNALAGTAVDLTGTGNNYQKLHWFPMYDYGQSHCGGRGSILILPSELNVKDNITDKLIYTSQMNYPDKVVVNQTIPLIPNRGYFITPKLNSSNIEDKYDQIALKYRPLRVDEKIIVKYRTEEKLDVPFGSFDKGQNIAGTWTDTNTFTTTLDMTNAEVGDEIEIVAGKGAGMLFHIESLSNNVGTWTVNLDEEFIHAVNAETMYFYVTNFKKLKTITRDSQNGIDFCDFVLGENNKFLQLKVELRGVDVTIEELQVNNTKLK